MSSATSNLSVVTADRIELWDPTTKSHKSVLDLAAVNAAANAVDLSAVEADITALQAGKQNTISTTAPLAKAGSTLSISDVWAGGLSLGGTLGVGPFSLIPTANGVNLRKPVSQFVDIDIATFGCDATTNATSLSLPGLTADSALCVDANRKIVNSTASRQQVDWLSTVTGPVQAQIDSKSNILQAVPGTGELLFENVAGIPYFKRVFGQAPIEIKTYMNLADGTDQKNANIEISIDPAALGASISVAPNLALISDTNGDVAASTTSSTELAYLTGTTSAVQTQLDAKSDKLETIAGTGGELVFVDVGGTPWFKRIFANAPLDIQTPYDINNPSDPTNANLVLSIDPAALASGGATGAVTSVLYDDLILLRVVVSDAAGKMIASGVHSWELDHLSGVTAGIQGQLNAKAALSGYQTFANDVEVVGTVRTNTISSRGTVISLASDVTVAGDLSVIGTYPGHPWIAGKIDGTGPTIITSNGRYAFTVSRSTLHSTGMFKITWTAAGGHPDGADYVVMLTSNTTHVEIINDAGHLPSSTSFEVKCTNSANSITNAMFWIIVMS